MNPAPAPPRPATRTGESPAAAPLPIPTAGPSRAARLRWYALTAAVALVLPLVGYRLDQTDVRVPFLYDDDALLILPMVKSTLEGGTHWRTERLGAWGVQELHDFPVVDHLHFALMWLLGRAVPDAALVFNLYYLLTYPLAALTAMAVLRHFGLSFPAAAVGGVLYAMQPYHYFRGENHYFLSAYYVVPLTLMVTLWITRGRLPFFPGSNPSPGPSPKRGGEQASMPAPPSLLGKGAGGLGSSDRLSVRDPDTLVAILVAVLTASAGAYYAYFACALLVGAGLYGWVAERTWKAAASAGLVIAVIVAGGVANHAPTFPYQYRYGRHSAPTERSPEEAEYYGLKITQLLLPIEGHSVRPFAEIKSMYNSYDRPVQSDTERYSLGAVAACGLLLLAARAVLPVRRGWPYTPLAALTLFTVLVGTVGGFGAVFNHLVSPQVRCYNRIAIYIAFLSLFAVLHALDGLIPRAAAWVGRRVGPRAGRVAGLAAWAAVCWFGVWDQTPYDWAGPTSFKKTQAQQDRYRADAEFFRDVEGVLNPDRAAPGPMVFQLPYVKWPESPTIHQLKPYDHARGYLHTDTLRWSFGCMRGREVDEWYRQVTSLVSPATGTGAVEQMLLRVVRAGFEGLLLDMRGYTPRAAATLRHELTRVLGAGTRQIVHPDGRQVFFDLRPHRDAVRQGRNWEAECRQETHPVQTLWLHGFCSFKEPGWEWQQRWCGPRGLAVFVNPTDDAYAVRATFAVRANSKEPAVLHVRGGDVWTEDLEIEKDSPLIERTFVIPPGRHAVHFRCDMPASHVPTDSRRLSFSISDWRAEVKPVKP